MRARLLFSCYRRDEAADPELYVTAVTMVLENYPADIVDAVTSPFSGLPARKNERGYSGLPDVADVKEACEAEAARRQRIAEARQYTIRQRRYVPPSREPGCWATVFVPHDAPRYQEMYDRAMSGLEDPRKWRYDTYEGKAGIWVAWTWWTREDRAKAPKTTWQPLTDEMLRKLYPGPQPPTPKQGGPDPNDVDTLDQPL